MRAVSGACAGYTLPFCRVVANSIIQHQHSRSKKGALRICGVAAGKEENERERERARARVRAREEGIPRRAEQSRAE